MKWINYVTFLAAGMVITGCKSKTEVPLTAGIRLENLDTSVPPGTSFYEYACGGWMKNHPLTNEYARFGSFDMLAENNREQLQELIEELSEEQHPQGSIPQKVGDLYRIAMDSVTLNREGAEPIRTGLAQLAGIQSVSEIYPLIARMQRDGLSPYFGISVGADQTNSTMNLVRISQGGLGMAERDYYLSDDASVRKIREKYQVYIEEMFRLAGFSDAEAKRAVKAVMDIETRLARAARSRVELRDPHANYNKQEVATLKEEIAGFDWDAYLAEVGLADLKEINVGQPASIQEVASIIRTVPLADQISYLQWRLINGASSYLSDPFVTQNFEFYDKTMSGKQEISPRWKRAVATVDRALGEAVGQMYIERYFPAAAKERMEKLVENLQKALGERIDDLDWMSRDTKEKAHEKLSSFHVKIGYPDQWKDYSTLEIKEDSYWDNMRRARNWAFAEMIAKAGKPVDRDEWFMTPQTVNAYYNPTTNEICFPAGILQYPFFDMEADDAFNYGAIGVVIGHEMTHGFDDQGRKYDKEGNLKDWWTAEDAKKFEERAEVMVAFFDSIQVLPDVYANGNLTLGENIADYGGIQVSYQAFRNATRHNELPEKDGFTPEQRFFLAYANVWAGNVRDEEILRRTKTDPHSLGRWRVDGILPHIGAWYEAFGITEQDPLYLPVEERVHIW
ncbi:MAG: M13 family metallopeptidase [Bacteroides sp.]|nr:M13 family metallopeptidase [Bacteroides sp.]